MPDAHRPSSLRRWWAAVAESLDSRLWPVPVTAVVAAVALGIVLPRIDILIDSRLPTEVDSAVFNGGADTARSVLSSIAGSLITATSLTFSLTVVALQLASSQASPRVLRLFARDRQVHWTLAAFLGTFAYSIAVLRAVRSATESDPELVPRVAVTVAFVLTLVSVVMLVFFLAHLAAQLRVETMLKDIHADTDRTIDLVGARDSSAAAFPGPVEVPGRRRAVAADTSGFITGRDLALLADVAVDRGLVVAEAKAVGDNVVAGMPLAFWWSDGRDDAEADAEATAQALRRAFTIGYERNAVEDVGYGVQQIVDIALRALSPGVNDPVTAVHALGHLTAVTARRIEMARPPAGVSGPDGSLRVVTLPRTVKQDIDAALTPLRHYGAGDPSLVARFLQSCLELSCLCDDPSARSALLGQLTALEGQLRASTADPVQAADLLALTAETRRQMREEAGTLDRGDPRSH
ncbi:DUF2254 domain-containing protein [Microbacterium oryzae]|uniref:DUF2254 domain-containing protein n=1 Tax=Microbacterium oryzae TaxID=743009 RepID=UPI0025B0A7A9|nr:DUF2254 domain-containing protein [Microbacterium oryzae]MDN3311380.1 DUF2254 domain-containing protein [Microbacterium oryzae]